jgi:hypothetical protein
MVRTLPLSPHWRGLHRTRVALGENGPGPWGRDERQRATTHDAGDHRRLGDGGHDAPYTPRHHGQVARARSPTRRSSLAQGQDEGPIFVSSPRRLAGVAFAAAQATGVGCPAQHIIARSGYYSLLSCRRAPPGVRICKFNWIIPGKTSCTLQVTIASVPPLTAASSTISSSGSRRRGRHRKCGLSLLRMHQDRLILQHHGYAGGFIKTEMDGRYGEEGRRGIGGKLTIP